MTFTYVDFVFVSSVYYQYQSMIQVLVDRAATGGLKKVTADIQKAAESNVLPKKA